MSIKTAKPLVILLAALMLLPFAFSGCQAQPPTNLDKAVSFLGDVLQLDMAHYQLANQPRPTSSDLTFNLAYNNSAFGIPNSIPIYFTFQNGALSTCNIYTAANNLHYLQPQPDRYSATIWLLQRYQDWSGDDGIAKMVTELKNLGSEKNITEAKGDLDLEISVTDTSVKYSFFDFYNGVKYTGITVTYNLGAGGGFLFHDTRAFQMVGDTTINLSEKHAVDIAEKYVRNYPYSSSYWNGTQNVQISQTGFNVSAVHAVYLESAAIGSVILLPYWHVWLNVSNPSTPNQQGFELYLSAKDGTVAQIKPFQLPYSFTPPPITDYQNPILLLVAALIFPLIGGLVAVLIVLIVVLKVTSPKPASAPQKEQRNPVRV